MSPDPPGDDAGVRADRALALDPDARSVRAARRFVADVLAGTSFTGEVDSAVLAVSEMVTNGVVHAVTPLDLRVVVRLHQERSGGRQVVRIELHDCSPQLPRAKSYGPQASTGRGLRMIGALSTDWGVYATPDGGKVVWAEIADEAGRSATGTDRTSERSSPSTFDELARAGSTTSGSDRAMLHPMGWGPRRRAMFA